MNLTVQSVGGAKIFNFHAFCKYVVQWKKQSLFLIFKYETLKIHTITDIISIANEQVQSK